MTDCATEYEEWRPIAGWEGLYEVSSHGRLRSLDRVIVNEMPWGRCERTFRGKIIKQLLGTDGYRRAQIRHLGKTKNLSIHVAVCEAFHGPRPPRCNALHNDGSRTNNHRSNLRWGTQAENMRDAKRHGVLKLGVDHPSAKLALPQIAKIRNTTSTEALKALASEYGIHVQHAYAVRRSHRHKETTTA